MIIVQICLQQPFSGMTYQHTNSNTMSSCFPNRQQGLKQKVRDLEDECFDDPNNSNTVMKPPIASKIRIHHDEEETRRHVWAEGKNTLVKRNVGKQSNEISQQNQNVNEKATIKAIDLAIPENKKVQTIINGKSLREKFQDILPPQLVLPISFDHQQLLLRMELIDNNISFLATQRNNKSALFQMLKESIYRNRSIIIQYRHLQQLLFLDEKSYVVEWQWSDRNKKYDIKVSLPKIDSEDQRKLSMRKNIVNWLKIKQNQFLQKNKQQKTTHLKWHPKFDIKLQIPELNFPIKPSQFETSIRAFPNEQIEKVQNPYLKHLFKKTKTQQQDGDKSISGASVAQMIFSGTPASKITQEIMKRVKEREQMNAKVAEEQIKQNRRIDKEAMITIFTEILSIYSTHKVSGMFKSSLLESLQTRLKSLKNDLIVGYLEELLEMKQLQFFKVVISSQKVPVIQITKQKYNTALTTLQNKTF